jgi:AcrR family transcriptional regulator
MQKMLGQVTIQLDNRLFIKDPVSTEVGTHIIQEGAKMIQRDGLEAFTFKKLAQEMGSTESTLYRYFTNKNQLVMYLSSWYWKLLEWKILFATANVTSPQVAFENILDVLSTMTWTKNDSNILSEELLHKLVVSESFKSLHMQDSDKNKREGYFSAYGNLAIRISDAILNLNPSYKFPKALATTLIETAHYQKFLNLYLPELTDKGKPNENLRNLLYQLSFNALKEK